MVEEEDEIDNPAAEMHLANVLGDIDLDSEMSIEENIEGDEVYRGMMVGADFHCRDGVLADDIQTIYTEWLRRISYFRFVSCIRT